MTQKGAMIIFPSSNLEKLASALPGSPSSTSSSSVARGENEDGGTEPRSLLSPPLLPLYAKGELDFLEREKGEGEECSSGPF